MYSVNCALCTVLNSAQDALIWSLTSDSVICAEKAAGETAAKYMTSATTSTESVH